MLPIRYDRTRWWHPLLLEGGFWTSTRYQTKLYGLTLLGNPRKNCWIEDRTAKLKGKERTEGDAPILFSPHHEQEEAETEKKLKAKTKQNTTVELDSKSEKKTVKKKEYLN